MNPTVLPEIDERDIQDESTDQEWMRKVVLHNCDCHTYEQVIRALMKTLPLSFEAARDYATLVDMTGAAVVYEGDLEKCEMIANNIVAWAGLGSKTGLPLQVTVEE
ncbi:MAG: ATP-dependent Clp protease adaptor ClpS [Armatimonadetes bacterium]|nr:ATP-dependent Clp protease adaptor ClpS [Armatimonadota bacterium]